MKSTAFGDQFAAKYGNRRTGIRKQRHGRHACGVKNRIFNIHLSFVSKHRDCRTFTGKITGVCSVRLRDHLYERVCDLVRRIVYQYAVMSGFHIHEGDICGSCHIVFSRGDAFFRRFFFVYPLGCDVERAVISIVIAGTRFDICSARCPRSEHIFIRRRCSALSRHSLRSFASGTSFRWLSSRTSLRWLSFRSFSSRAFFEWLFLSRLPFGRISFLRLRFCRRSFFLYRRVDQNICLFQFQQRRRFDTPRQISCHHRVPVYDQTFLGLLLLLRFHRTDDLGIRRDRKGGKSRCSFGVPHRTFQKRKIRLVQIGHIRFCRKPVPHGGFIIRKAAPVLVPLIGIGIDYRPVQLARFQCDIHISLIIIMNDGPVQPGSFDLNIHAFAAFRLQVPRHRIRIQRREDRNTAVRIDAYIFELNIGGCRFDQKTGARDIIFISTCRFPVFLCIVTGTVNHVNFVVDLGNILQAVGPYCFLRDHIRV